MIRKSLALSAVFGALLVGLPALAHGDSKQCFHMSEMQGWKAPDAKTMYIRVGVSRYFRLDLAYECPMLKSIGAFLVTKAHGSDMVCDPIDWDLKVAEPPPGSFVEPCMVKAMTPMTAAEVKAIPPEFKP
jgi:hypothetical protein